MQLQMIINSLGLGRLLFVRVTNLINAYNASYSSAISSSVCIVKVYSTKTTGQILFPLAIKKATPLLFRPSALLCSAQGVERSIASS
jgi:hypothetical protein